MTLIQILLAAILVQTIENSVTPEQRARRLVWARVIKRFTLGVVAFLLIVTLPYLIVCYATGN